MARVAAAGVGSAALILLLLAGTGGDLVSISRAFLVPHPAAARLHAARVPRAPASPLRDTTGPRPQTSFTGDEVNPALATYGIDRDGNMYEVHSPHTEEPRLPPPTT
jgi:hypothetical protein